MKKHVKAVSVMVVLAGALVVYGQTPPAKKDKPTKAAASAKEDKPDADENRDLAAFMRMQLNHSQKALEGLVTEDFKLMAHHSNQMALLVQDENWMIVETPEYRHHSADFQMVANRLTEAARTENLDGATLAYVDLMMSCVNCHKYTRGVRLAARP
jgi:cytochrome c556